MEILHSGMDWRQVEDALLRAGMGYRIDAWTICPACGERILQAVGSLHIREEHPKIADDLERARAGLDGVEVRA